MRCLLIIAKTDFRFFEENKLRIASISASYLITSLVVIPDSFVYPDFEAPGRYIRWN
jgi:hypothetical protein